MESSLLSRKPFARPLNRLRARLRETAGGGAATRAVVLFGAVLGLDSADKATLGATAAQLKHQLVITNTEVGVLAAAATALSALATVPAGALVDRTNRVRLLAGSVGLWGVAMIWTGLAGSFTMLLISRVALGIVLATAGPAIASLTGDLFPEDRRARVFGYILTGDLVGSGVGFLISGNVAGVLSWRFAFILLALPSALVAWLLWRHLPEPRRGAQTRNPRPQQDPAREVAQELGEEPNPNAVVGADARHMSLWRAIVYVFRIPTNVLLVLASAIGYFFFGGLRTFAIVFARGHFGLSQSVASTLFTLVGVGAIVGVVAGGRIADKLMSKGRLNARVLVGVVGFAAAPLFLAPGLISTSLMISLPLFFIGTAAFSAPNPTIDAARLDVVPWALRGRAEGARTVARAAAETAGPLAFGVLADTFAGSGGKAHGAEIAFLIMLIPLALNGLLLLPALKSYGRDVAAAAASEAIMKEEDRDYADERSGGRTNARER
ncbi:MAG TPA: MFS transporter [Thermoleophilaceae bacterium]